MVFVGCSAHVSCGKTKNLNVEKGEEFVSSVYERVAGQKPTAVKCPGPVEMKKGVVSECTASFGAATATVGLTQTDDIGGVTITSVSGVVFATELEATVAKDFGSKLNVHLEVACGERVRPAVAGGTFTCDAKDARGTSGKVVVTMEDDKGNVKFRLAKPEESAAPPAQ